MSGFGEVPAAARARDIIERIVVSVVDKVRPEPFLAKVYDIDVGRQTARVLLPGETLNELMTVRFALDKIPRVLMVNSPSEGLNASGDIVRVAGKPGQYFVLDFFSGNPYVPGVAEGVALHENPSFEGAWENSFPVGWERFWNTAGVIGTQETVDVLDGSASLKMTRPDGGTCRVHAKNSFPVTAGEAITLSVWAKASGSTGTMQMGFITGPTQAGADFFGSGAVQQYVTVPLTTQWAKYEMTIAVPATHIAARQTFLLANTAAASMDFWLDDSFSSRPNYVPWINVDGSDYSGQPNLFTNSWINFGGVKQKIQYRKVGDIVEIRGDGKNGTIGLSAFTLPVGYRPPNELTFGTYAASAAIPGVIDVRTDGTVVPTQGNNGHVAFSCVRFSTI